MRCITFNIGPGLQLKLTEKAGGSILFELQGIGSLVDIRGLYFDVRDPSVLGNLAVSGADITSAAFADEGVNRIGPGVNMNGTGAAPFDAGIGFGSPGVGRDEIQSTSFMLSTTDGSPLTLDLLAHVDFGVELGGAAGKAVTFSPAAPDANDDATSAREDESTGFLVLANDTDEDVNDILVFTSATDPAHGSVVIASDGRSVIYLSDLNYSGPDSFFYEISDGNGGCDTAFVTVDVIAVADVPDLSVEVLAGSVVNEIKFNIRADVTDTDGSEFIDRLEFSGLPAGAFIVGGNVIDDPGTPGTVMQQVTLLLTPGFDYDFDLGIKAVSEEKSNADQAEALRTIPIEYEVNSTQYTRTFEAVGQSVWATGKAPNFHKAGFIGIGGDSPISGHFDPPVPVPLPNYLPGTPIPAYPLVGPAFVDFVLDVKAGFNYDLLVDTGTINATAPYTTTLTTSFNRTTDALLIEPFATPEFGTRFNTTSPQAKLKLDFVFDFKLDVDVSLLGVAEIFSDTIEFNINVPVVELGTNDISFAVPLGAGFTVNFAFPTFNATSGQGTGAAQANVTSNDIVHVEWDLVQAVPEAFGIPGDFLDPVTVKGELSLAFLEDVAQELVDSIVDTIEDIFGDIFGDTDIEIGAKFDGKLGLIDADLFAALKVIQQLNLTANTLGGKLLYETGAVEDLPFGVGKLISDASSLDVNGDDIIDFDVMLSPQARLRNDIDLGIDVGYNLALLPFTGSFNVLGQGGSFNLSVFDVQDRAPLPIPSIGVYDETFDLVFGPQTVDLFVG